MLRVALPKGHAVSDEVGLPVERDHLVLPCGASGRWTPERSAYGTGLPNCGARNGPTSGIRILYEDNHLLVVEKPVNVPVQADASGGRGPAFPAEGVYPHAL